MAFVVGHLKQKYMEEKRKRKVQTPHLYKCQPAVTYLSLFQTPKGFKQVAQVTPHTIKILEEKNKTSKRLYSYC